MTFVCFVFEKIYQNLFARSILGGESIRAKIDLSRFQKPECVLILAIRNAVHNPLYARVDQRLRAVDAGKMRNVTGSAAG